MDYRTEELLNVKNQEAHDGGFYKLKVTAAQGETKWLNITPQELDGIYQLLNEPYEDWVQHLKDYREFLQWDQDESVDYTKMTQEEAKEALINDLEFIIGTNGVGELFDSERAYCELVGIDLDEPDLDN